MSRSTVCWGRQVRAIPLRRCFIARATELIDEWQRMLMDMTSGRLSAVNRHFGEFVHGARRVALASILEILF